jgi:TPR repeat protein
VATRRPLGTSGDCCTTRIRRKQNSGTEGPLIKATERPCTTWASCSVAKAKGEKPKSWWTRSANLGYPSSMRALGRLLYPRHRRAGRRWLEKAADQGDSIAMVDLARSMWKRRIVFLGWPIPKPPAQELMRRAADKGNPNAMWYLAVWAYADNRDSEFRQWLEAGAERGHRGCKLALEKGLNFGSLKELLKLQNEPWDISAEAVSGTPERLPR